MEALHIVLQSIAAVSLAVFVGFTYSVMLRDRRTGKSTNPAVFLFTLPIVYTALRLMTAALTDNFYERGTLDAMATGFMIFVAGTVLSKTHKDYQNRRTISVCIGSWYFATMAYSAMFLIYY